MLKRICHERQPCTQICVIVALISQKYLSCSRSSNTRANGAPISSRIDAAFQGCCLHKVYDHPHRSQASQCRKQPGTAAGWETFGVLRVQDILMLSPSVLVMPSNLEAFSDDLSYHTTGQESSSLGTLLIINVEAECEAVCVSGNFPSDGSIKTLFHLLWFSRTSSKEKNSLKGSARLIG